MSSFFAYNTVINSKIHSVVEEQKKLVIKEEPKKKSWSIFLKENKITKDRYPADEIMLIWDLVDSSLRKETLYRLSVEGIDRYQYFCLMQVLENKKIKKQIKKENNLYKIYINLHNSSAAKLLIDELMAYDIDAKISKITVDMNIPYSTTK
jgi:hypothetical protein